MIIEYAINYSDAMEQMPDWLPDQYAWVYLGAYFCDRYFVTTSPALWKSCFENAQKQRKKVALVIPTASQNNLALLKERTRTIINRYNVVIQELVVNDYGMLEWVQEQFPEIPVWLGRTMNKELRDIRYSYTTCHTKIYEQLEAGYIQCSSVLGVEVDQTVTDEIRIQEGKHRIAVHCAWIYHSMCRICEFASIDAPLDKKFRLFQPCKRECIHNSISYDNYGFHFVKYGRAVYAPVQEYAFSDYHGTIRMITCGYLPFPSMESSRNLSEVTP